MMQPVANEENTDLCAMGAPAASPATASPQFPWQQDHPPLMLAPMQGLTNQAMRRLFIDWVRPDTVFTEFMRVNAAAPVRRLSAADLREVAPQEEGVPLVVQLIGHGREALVSAARSAQAAGAAHINLNLGCPYGRMTSGLTGGGMLKRPELLEEIIFALRAVVTGSFSVKLRSGYDDPSQIFGLLPLFEAAGVDFLVLHPRTVAQEYQGLADHAITSRVVRQTRLPVIANGDIRTAADGARLLEESGAAGLMLGRGAIADPFLFERLRGRAPVEPARPERAAMLRHYLQELLARYGGLFCGETQILNKVKGVLATFVDADFEDAVRQLRKARTMPAFRARLAELE
jgi:tRNA-dihydrouridine synthase